MQTIQVGLIGLGNVGGGVAAILVQQADLITRRLGARLVLKRAARRHPERSSDVPLSAEQVTGDALSIIHDPEIDIVVELMGGYEPARTYLLEALRAGKHVVTANKALLAEHGQELFEAAAAAELDIGFEASVGGGIPVVRTIKEGFVANRFGAIASIINGTCNYILSRMSDEDLDFAEAPERGAGLGVRRSRPALRHRGHRRRAENRPARLAGLRLLGAARTGLHRGHRRPQPPGHRLRQRAGLPRQAAGACQSLPRTRSGDGR